MSVFGIIGSSPRFEARKRSKVKRISGRKFRKGDYLGKSFFSIHSEIVRRGLVFHLENQCVPIFFPSVPLATGHLLHRLHDFSIVHTKV